MISLWFCLNPCEDEKYKSVKLAPHLSKNNFFSWVLNAPRRVLEFLINFENSSGELRQKIDGWTLGVLTSQNKMSKSAITLKPLEIINFAIRISFRTLEVLPRTLNKIARTFKKIFLLYIKYQKSRELFKYWS